MAPTWAVPGLFPIVIYSQQLLDNLCRELPRVCGEIYTLIPSSAGIVRMFTSLGYIHDETPNRLSIEKAEN